MNMSLAHRGLVVALACACAATSAPAQQVIENALTANAHVRTMVRSGNTIYIGGDFSRLAPSYGGAVATDASTGALVGTPHVSGTVQTVVPDGSGGFYIGGAFFHAGGEPRSNIAHVRPDHTISEWNPGAAGVVTVILPSDTTVYFGVSIDGGNTALYAAGPSTPYGAARKLKESTNGPITSLAKVGNRLYLGGGFIHVTDGIQYDLRPGAAAIDATTGETILSFNPGHLLDYSHPVSAIAANETTVFVGGQFTDFGGQTRYHLAALDAETGLAIPWHTDPENGYVSSMILVDSTLYVGGGFAFVGGAERRGLAALDIGTGLARSWNPGVTDTRYRLSISGTTLYAIGFLGTAAYDLDTGQTLAWQPPAAIVRPNDVAASGSLVYLGYQINAVGAQARNKVAALDAITGRVLDWNPGAENTVHAIAIEGSTVYLGGDFEKVGNVRRSRLAAVDAATGALKPWDPGADGPVYALAPAGGTVYVGGDFLHIGTQPAANLAAVDASTGTAAPGWGANLTVYALAVQDSRLYAGGNFDTLAGTPRNHLGALDRATGLATTWNPDLNNAVYAMQIRDSLLFVSGRFSRVSGSRRGRLASIGLVGGVPTAWSPEANDAIRAFSIFESTVYVAGDFDTIGTEPRSRVASLDLKTGAPQKWNPTFDATMRAIAPGEGVVYAGGDFTYHDHLPTSFLATIDDDRTTPVLLSRFDAEPLEDGIAIRWQLAGDVAVSHSWVERADTPRGVWTRVTGDVRPDGDAFVVIDRAVEPGRTYDYRLIVDADGMIATLGSVRATATTPRIELALTRVSPSPTSGVAAIDFSVPRAAHVRLSILDVQGREVARLVDGWRTAGGHQTTWTGRDGRRLMRSGIYFVALDALGERLTRRIVVAR